MEKLFDEIQLDPERAKAYLESLNDYAIIAITNPRGVITKVNKNFCEISGYNESELLGRTHKLVNSSYHPKEFWDNCWSTIKSGNVWRAEVKNKSKNGSFYWVDTTIFPVKVNGEVIEFIAIRNEITRRIIFEEKLAKHIDQLKNFVSNLPAAVAMFDKNMCYIAHSDKWLTDYSLEGESLIGRSHYEVFPNIPERWKEDHQLALTGVALKSDEDSFIGINRKEWLKWDVRPWFDTDGNVGGVLMLTEVITQSKNKQKEFELILKHTHFGIWKYNILTKDLFWDDSMYNLYETNSKDFIPTVDNWKMIIKSEETRKMYDSFEEIFKVRDELTTTFEVQLFDGRIKHIGSRATIERDDLGNPLTVLGINFDKTKEVEDRKKIIKTNQYLDLALEGANLGVWNWENEQDFIKYDSRLAKMIGLNKENEISFEKWISLIHPDEKEDFIKTFNQLLNAEILKIEIIHRVRHKSGHYVYVFNQGKVSSWDSSGKALKFNGTFLDITKQKLQEQDLLVAKERAEKLEKAKSEFLANMSHELRSPMNGVLGMISLISETRLTAEQKKMLRTVKSCGESLLTILNDILDLSKIESGKIELESISFSLYNIIDDAISLYKFAAKDKGIELLIENHLPKDLALCGDMTRLRQVIINLVSNAIKFTDEGEVRVILQGELKENNLHQIKITVKDTGVGIPKAAQKKLFQAFTQADNSITRKYGGTGLGLTISLMLTKLMKGKIDFESQEGVGTSFIVDLNLPLGKKEDIFEEKIEVTRNLDHLNVLLVEDNIVNQQVASLMMKKLNLKVELATNGLIAVEKIAEKGPTFFDIIFMDMQMPVLDGISTTKHLVELYDNNLCPIVAMTANAFESDKEACYNSGMVDFISKPIKSERIAQAIQKWVVNKK